MTKPDIPLHLTVAGSHTIKSHKERFLVGMVHQLYLSICRSERNYLIRPIIWSCKLPCFPSYSTRKVNHYSVVHLKFGLRTVFVVLMFLFNLSFPHAFSGQGPGIRHARHQLRAIVREVNLIPCPGLTQGCLCRHNWFSAIQQEKWRCPCRLLGGHPVGKQ